MSTDSLKFLSYFGDDHFFQTFDDKKKGNRIALTERRWSLQEFECKAPALHNINKRHGAGIYFCVNSLQPKGRRTSDNIEAVRALFVDLDGAPLQPVMDWALKPNLVVQTSADRWHAYWLLDDYYPGALKQFRDLQRWLANKFGGDRAVNDLCRVMRVPGFLNMKKEPFEVIFNAVWPQPYKLESFTDAYNNDKNMGSEHSARELHVAIDHNKELANWMDPEALRGDVGRGGIENARDDFTFDERRLRAALATIPSDDYDVWMRVGMALQGSSRREDAEISEEEGFEYWIDWSSSSAKFDDVVAEEKWQGMNARGELGLGTIFELARQQGWNGGSGRTADEVKAAGAKKITAKTVIDMNTPEGKLKALRLGIKS